MKARSLIALACAGTLALLALPASAAEAPSLSAHFGSPDFRSINLQWTGVPGPTGTFLVERSITGSEDGPREWQGIADVTLPGQDGIRPDARPATVAYRDDALESPGWHCYRVRAKADDFAWSNEACLVRPVVDGPPPAANDLPKPVSVRWEPAVQPPDIVGVWRIFSWDWPEDPGVDAVIEASVPPRLAGDVVPPYIEYARIADGEPSRISVTTLQWRGPYCFRVRFARGEELGAPSPAACVSRTADSAPYDITTLDLRRSSSNEIWLTWEYLFFPTTVMVQRSLAAAGEAPAWVTVAEGVPARSTDTMGRWDDPNPPPGYACYRVKASRGGIGEFGEDSLWSEARCISRPPGPINDFPGYPFPPDAGDSPRPGVEPRDHLPVALALSASLALVATASWWATRRS